MTREREKKRKLYCCNPNNIQKCDTGRIRYRESCETVNKLFSNIKAYSNCKSFCGKYKAWPL